MDVEKLISGSGKFTILEHIETKMPFDQYLIMKELLEKKADNSPILYLQNEFFIVPLKKMSEESINSLAFDIFNEFKYDFVLNKTRKYGRLTNSIEMGNLEITMNGTLNIMDETSHLGEKIIKKSLISQNSIQIFRNKADFDYWRNL